MRKAWRRTAVLANVSACMLLVSGANGGGFEISYLAGTYDPNGQFMGGTEVVWLVPHKGKLFAAVGYWGDEPGGDPAPGPQVLRKDTAAGPWFVDRSWGPDYVRVDSLASATFHTDWTGARLPEPMTLLIASAGDNAPPYEIATWTRDDTTAQWTRSVLGVTSEPWRSYMRYMIVHRDKVTRIDHLFGGGADGGVYRGGYDPNAPGRIRWSTEPELQPSQRRCSNFAIANGDLYVAISPRIGRRIDGPQPTWQVVHERDPIKYGETRGLTAVPNPNGPGEVLVGYNIDYHKIERYDPSQGHAMTVELDVPAFTAAQIYGDGRLRPAWGAYNAAPLVRDPASGVERYLIGSWLYHADWRYNGPRAWYFLRDGQANYELGGASVCGYTPCGTPAKLTGVRTIVLSPFPEHGGRVLYFGGFDSGGYPSHNTAWIFQVPVDFALNSLPTCPGDLNCDGQVSFADISPFVLALADPPAYRRTLPGCEPFNADVNDDGRLDFVDINPFVELLGTRE